LDQGIEVGLLLCAEFEVDCDAAQSRLRADSTNVILRTCERCDTPLKRRCLRQIDNLRDSIPGLPVGAECVYAERDPS
jgi:hypothetical protein